MSQVNVLSQMKKHRALRAYQNIDGSFSLQLPDDSILQSVAPVYALPGITIPGVAALPDANTFETGSIVRLHKDNFVGAGASQVGVEIVADALNNIWRPRGHQVLWEGFLGLRASPAVSRTTTGRFDIGVDPVLPANLLNYAGASLRFHEVLFETNAGATTSPTVAVYIGTDLVTYTNNKTVINNDLLNGNNVTAQPETLVMRAGATSALSTRGNLRGGLGSTGTILQDVSGGLLNFAAAQMITYAMTAMGSATQVDMHRYRIIWES